MRTALIAASLAVLVVLLSLSGNIQSQEKPPARQETSSPDPNQADQALLHLVDRSHIQMAEKAQKYVAKIRVKKDVELPFPNAQDNKAIKFTTTLNLSGILVDPRGYILTLADPIENAKHLSVFLPDNRIFEASIHAMDKVSRLAILKIQADDLQAVEFADSSKVRVGQLVAACGNPFGLERSVSFGNVSGISRMVIMGENRFFGIIQLDATINPGDPGGLCMNASGEMIGILWSSFSGDTMNRPEQSYGLLLKALDGLMSKFNLPSEREEIQREINRLILESQQNEQYMTSERINFLLPSNQVRKITSDLIEHGRVRRAKMGVALVLDFDEERRRYVIMVKHVVEGSPAEQAGILEGDCIIELNGHKVRSIYSVYEQLLEMNPGDTIEIKIDRDGKLIPLKLKLAEID